MSHRSRMAATILAIATCTAPAWAQHSVLGLPDGAVSARGTVVLGGGGRTTEQIRGEFVRLAGGCNARLVLIPSACTYSGMDEIEAYFSVWRQQAVASLVFLDAASRPQADSPEFVRPLDTATGVWMPGGGQKRLADLYAGTLVEEALRRVLQRGGVVGGTSAGAAVLSRVMILGGVDSEVDTSRGLGLLGEAVVDQHFSQRGRHSRLLRVLEDHPSLLGLGVDEDTALFVQGDHLRVVGESQVTVCIPTEPRRAILLYRLQPGDEADLAPPDQSMPALPVRVALHGPPR